MSNAKYMLNTRFALCCDHCCRCFLHNVTKQNVRSNLTSAGCMALCHTHQCQSLLPKAPAPTTSTQMHKKKNKKKKTTTHCATAEHTHKRHLQVRHVSKKLLIQSAHSFRNTDPTFAGPHGNSRTDWERAKLNTPTMGSEAPAYAIHWTLLPKPPASPITKWKRHPPSSRTK